jgi:hypothetical protein
VQQWKSGKIINLFWSREKEVLNVATENGKLFQVNNFLMFMMSAHFP